MSGLLRDDREPLSRDDEGMLEEIGTVEEKRMVLRDARIKVDALKKRDEVRRGRCGLGKVGEERRVAERGRVWRGGVELQVSVEALELEDSKP